MLEMPTLTSDGLLIRPFMMEDLSDVHRLLDPELGDAILESDRLASTVERAEWLAWTVRSYEQLAKLRQPPYGDRAVILASTGQLIGMSGFVPLLNAFESLTYSAGGGLVDGPARYSTEFGLYYAIAPAFQRRGYGTEAARALVAYAFQQLRVSRIVATTDHDNLASIGVMRKLGMQIKTNPQPDPPWLQVVGVLENDV